MLELGAALLCILANGFFVGAEFALAKVRPTALEALAKNEGDALAARALRLTQRLDQVLPATQLGITLASLGLGWLGEPAVAHLLAPPLHSLGLSEAAVEGVSVAVGFSTISMLHIVIGELVPKALALQRPEALARYSAGALQAFYYAFFPALVLLNAMSKLVLRGLGLPAPDHAEGKLSLEELRLIIQASFEGIEERKRDMLERVLRATDRPVRAIMIPRVDMEILSLLDPPATWLARVRKHGFSRYPVSKDGNPDHVIGYVYVKDLMLLRNSEQPTLAALKRDILIVPESRTVGDILGEFQSSKIPIAIVVDEYGGTSGLVTLEDAVAEIVGDLSDELKGAAQPRYSLQEDGSVVADGSLPIDDLVLDGFRLPELEETADTVGGYVIASLGRLAHPGDRIELGPWEAYVEDVRARRVHRVRFSKRAASELDEPPVTTSRPPRAP